MAEALITISAKGFGCIGVYEPGRSPHRHHYGRRSAAVTMAADLTACATCGIGLRRPRAHHDRAGRALAADALRQMTAGERKDPGPVRL